MEAEEPAAIEAHQQLGAIRIGTLGDHPWSISDVHIL